MVHYARGFSRNLDLLLSFEYFPKITVRFMRELQYDTNDSFLVLSVVVEYRHYFTPIFSESALEFHLLQQFVDSWLVMDNIHIFDYRPLDCGIGFLSSLL